MIGKEAKNSLVIVESPAKARTIKKFLGPGFDVKASMGHIRDLPEKDLGVDVEHGYRPHYTVIKGKRKIIKELRSSAQKAETVYLAPDPDREGEAIAWHVAQELGVDDHKIHRIRFNEITQKAISTAVREPQPIDMHLVDAQQARRIMDRLVGYKVSPFLWRTLYSGLSAGRVQSVALRLLCEREELIENFIPQEYWTIAAQLRGKKGDPFIAVLAAIEGKKAVIPDQGRAASIVDLLKDKPFTVTEVKRQQQAKNPGPPFVTSTLQQDAARALHFSVQKTMRVAQQLYEGLDIGQNSPVGLITYMRTDAPRVAEEALAEVRGFIRDQFGEKYLPPQPCRYRSKRGAQEAHEAIRPTAVSRRPEELKPHLDKDQHRLYQLIWKRFVASQMKAARFAVTKVQVKADGHLFKATGSVPIFDGFLSVYQETQDEKAGDEGASLPALARGEKLQLLSLKPEQHFTKPPPRYTEASLVKALETEGIGRPSTYAQIITTLKTRKYVHTEKRSLLPNELGRTVNRLLVENFPDIFGVKFTASMEEELDRVETGENQWVEVLDDFYQPFSKVLEKANSRKARLKSSLQKPTEEVCQLCGHRMVVKWGRNGRFLACSNFPKCRNTKPLPGEDLHLVSDELCERCGSQMVIKTGRFGRFLACSKYPQCRNTRAVRIGVRCPREGCSGHLVERKTKSGRLFYGCSEYPKCTFASWNKPVDLTCPHCGTQPLVEKKSRDGGKILRCLQCKKEMSPEEAEGDK